MEQAKPVIGVVGLGGESVFLSVDHFHAPGETLHANGFFVEPGGKAYNQAVAAARLGAKVYFFGAVGSDSSGSLCRDVLTSEGITPVLQTIPHANTAFACILTDHRGENQVTVSRGAADCLSADFIYAHESYFAKCTHVLLGLECPLDATLAVLDLAQKHHLYTILNPAPALPVELDFLRRFDLITPNQQEAAALLGLKEQPSPEELSGLLRKNEIFNAVVTLGSRGAMLLNREECALFPALAVEAVDTTGAGDTFNAALAVMLGKGASLPGAVEYAINASAYSITKHHVLDSLPTSAQLEPLLQKIMSTSL